jgi:hypothetical protein
MITGTIIGESSMKFSGTETEIIGLREEFERRTQRTKINADEARHLFAKKINPPTRFELQIGEGNASLTVTTNKSWHQIANVAHELDIPFEANAEEERINLSF